MPYVTQRELLGRLSCIAQIRDSDVVQADKYDHDRSVRTMGILGRESQHIRPLCSHDDGETEHLYTATTGLLVIEGIMSYHTHYGKCDNTARCHSIHASG